MLCSILNELIALASNKSCDAADKNMRETSFSDKTN